MNGKILITILLSILTVIFLVQALPAQAAFNPFCTTDSSGNCVSGPCKDAPSSPACQQNKDQNGNSTNPAVNIIRTAVNIIAILAGIASVIVIIISGFQFVTAGGLAPGQRSGDPNRIKSARSALTGALVGLVIIALAWTLVTFITDHLTG